MDATGSAPQGLREYGAATPDRVARHYAAMHAGQTVDWVDSMRRRFDVSGGRCSEEMTIAEAAERFRYVDEADPDFEADNLLHCYQTGEACRRELPDLEWMHLVGFLHDLGKAPLERAGLPQWSIGGDIFPVGCAFDPANVYPDAFANNPDAGDPRYATPLGIYEAGCGFENVVFAYGHDQYLYDVLSNHPECRIPADGLYVVRFHSFYAWHQQGGYGHLASVRDRELLPLLRAFQRCDLYSKVGSLPDPDALLPYYEGLAARYCPGALRW